MKTDTNLDELSQEEYNNCYWHFLKYIYPYFSVQVICPETQKQLDQISNKFESLISSEPNIHPASYTYYVFANRNGICYTDALNDIDWPLKPVDYLQSVVYLWNDNYEDVYKMDDFVSLDSIRSEDHVVAYQYTIETYMLESPENSSLDDLVDLFNSVDFPLRREFDQLCKWYSKVQNRVRKKEKAPFLERMWDMR